MSEFRVLHGDCRDVMATLDADSVDAVVCDPPYGLSFMGREWDHGVPGVPFWAEALRVAKPGAHLVAFGGTRTFHRLTVAIEDAGWEIRDCLSWLYGSGFPKSLNIGGGFGTALKPAWEPIILARKPLKQTVAANVQEYGTGALNIDGCRIATNGERPTGSGRASVASIYSQVATSTGNGGNVTPDAGRWPANVVLDEEAAGMLDEQSGELAGSGNTRPSSQGEGMFVGGSDPRFRNCHDNFGGGASRFFYTAKASRSERNEGLDGMAGTAERRYAGGPLNRPDHEASDGVSRTGARPATANHHPTVKPVELMRWLCRLVTPRNGLVLDPFCGSGSTGVAAIKEGFRFVGVEREAEYVEIARRRIGAAPLNLFAEPAA